MLDRIISNLIAFAKTNLSLDERDEFYAIGKILDILHVGSYNPVKPDCNLSAPPDAILDELVDYCVNNGIIEDYEAEGLIDKVMDALSLPPSVIGEVFKSIVKENGSRAATDWFYKYCVDNAYVKRAKLDKNPRFDVGKVTVTINKSKPEFRDPQKAKVGNSVSGGYPKCVICRENEGYAPRNKRTLRTVDVTLGGEKFFWQYSPYGYFNEHGIVVNSKHIPMYVDKTTFYKLMDFVDLFPHYFLGCNAPLPRIGGSVLAHDHYQGGGETLPLHKAGIRKHLKLRNYPNVEICIADWPGTVLRISSTDRDVVAEIAELVRSAWVGYNNEKLGIIASDNEGIHNTVSPTVVKAGDKYVMNIILRSNITSEQYPEGVFHAHPEFHEIKKESIGLIEAQGLFILPGRLEAELAEVERCIEKGSLDNELERFKLVYDEAKAIFDGGVSAHEAVEREIGSICYRILQNTAVFKSDDDFMSFLRGVGFNE